MTVMKEFTRIIGVEGTDNLGVLQPLAVYRSGAPRNFTALATALHLKSILNLQDSEQQEIVEAAGLKYFQLRLNVLSDVDPDTFDLIVQTLSEVANWPILVHCYSGSDRTGVACAAYRMAVDGWTLAEALAEMDAYGAHYLLDPKLKWHLEQWAKTKGLT